MEKTDFQINSYGVIPIQINKFYKTCLVYIFQHNNGGHWSFPKGRVEKLDTDNLATAERELYEESGLKIKRWINRKRINEIYSNYIEYKYKNKNKINQKK